MEPEVGQPTCPRRRSRHGRNPDLLCRCGKPGDAANGNPVDYAVAIQLSDHFGGRTYFEDREAYDDNMSYLGTEEKVRSAYAEALPYARAAFYELN